MIEQAGKKKMLLFSGSSNQELAEKVAKELGTDLAEVDKNQFANGEIYIRLQEEHLQKELLQYFLSILTQDKIKKHYQENLSQLAWLLIYLYQQVQIESYP